MEKLSTQSQFDEFAGIFQIHEFHAIKNLEPLVEIKIFATKNLGSRSLVLHFNSSIDLHNVRIGGQ